jgi:trk system potassium uptake protein TrkA
MGCGRLGASIATALLEEGHRIRILDTNPDNFGRLLPGHMEQGYIVPIVGDGTLYRDLRKAAIQDADVFIALSGRDTRNALAAQIARHIFEVPLVICRMNDPVRQEMYESLGLIAISGIGLVTSMVVGAARV